MVTTTETLTNVFLCKSDLAPQYFCVYITPMLTSNNHSCNTRNASQLKLPKTRIPSFNVTGLKIRNRLSLEIKNSHSVTRTLQKHVSGKPPF